MGFVYGIWGVCIGLGSVLGWGSVPIGLGVWGCLYGVVLGFVFRVLEHVFGFWSRFVTFIRQEDTMATEPVSACSASLEDGEIDRRYRRLQVHHSSYPNKKG